LFNGAGFEGKINEEWLSGCVGTGGTVVAVFCWDWRDCCGCVLLELAGLLWLCSVGTGGTVVTALGLAGPVVAVLCWDWRDCCCCVLLGLAGLLWLRWDWRDRLLLGSV
jgi:hypothetical protein